METWVKEWLQEQRNKGEKCLEAKASHKAYYIYRSTTYWDKKTKKPRKTSKYIGKLDFQKGLILSKKPIKSNITHRNVFRYGDALLLHRALIPLLPLLKEAYEENWQEIYALALVRITGYVPLKRVKARWSKLYNPQKISPQLDPKHLSETLKHVGVDRVAQDKVFKGLMQGSSYAYDLSFMFTRSTMNIGDLGYNSHKIYVPQVNVVLFSSAEHHLPMMVRVVPGSIRDVSTIKTSIAELNLSGITLVFDRGLFSEPNIKTMHTNKPDKVNFLIPARRNSHLYDEAKSGLDNHFFYRERLIKCSKSAWGELWLYLFEDQRLKEEEEATLYGLFDGKKIGADEFNLGLAKAGRILIVSNLDYEEMTLFERYKGREEVEQHFDTFKNTLRADLLYLQDDESVFGHVFVSFLSLYGYCVLQNMLRSASLLDKFSPLDLLEEFSSVYMLVEGLNEIVTEVPKKARELDEKIGTNLFPKNQS